MSHPERFSGVPRDRLRTTQAPALFFAARYRLAPGLGVKEHVAARDARRLLGPQVVPRADGRPGRLNGCCHARPPVAPGRVSKYTPVNCRVIRSPTWGYLSSSSGSTGLDRMSMAMPAALRGSSGAPARTPMVRDLVRWVPSSWRVLKVAVTWCMY